METPAKPTHYSRLDPQPIEVIEAWNLGWNKSCVIKYVARAGHKEDAVRDLKKAIWHLRREIAILEGTAGKPEPQA